MDPLQVFENFKLDTLDEKWSDEVWDREFLSFSEPPLEYSILLGSEDMEQCLRETSSTLKSWMAQNREKDASNSDERPEVSWQTIAALDVNVRGLLAVLGYLMKTGQASGADEDSRQTCLTSTSLYFVLLSIPGSSTFNVFHPNLYHRAIETLKLSELLVVSCKRRGAESESLYGDQPEEISASERNALTRGLNDILRELMAMLKTFYMKYQLRSLEITVINLVEVTKLDTEVNHFAASGHDRRRRDARDESLSTLAFNAYAALRDLLQPRHGAEDVTIKVIMRYLMPQLCPHHLDLPVRAASVVWDTTICFLRNILHSKGSLAEEGMEILIQNLLVNCPDRSEPRQRQAGVIARLINICEGKLFIKCIENVVLFSFHNKIPFRIFGQEVTSKLLAEMSMDFEAESEVRSRKRARVALIATAQSRSIDVSSMVRGKSLSTIESLVNSENFAVGDFLNTSEENRPLPTPDDILQSLAAENGANPLPGTSAFTSMLLDRITDERALVRRSTLHVLQRLASLFPDMLDKVAPIIGQHCRDPAMIVRKDAIHALACLLRNNPADKGLLNEYVKSALPRIYDVEAKVQERVLESLQTLVLDGIQEFSDDEEEEEESRNLPWDVLRELTRARMRKNLSKVCEFWAKNKVINESTIHRISSHVGTAHDDEAWVLLLALAENGVALPNVGRHFEDVKKLLEDDSFAGIIKLEVLRQIWPSMDGTYLESLSRHCFESLIKFRVPLESIGACVDILDGITKHRSREDDGDLMHTQIVNLMRLSEAQIDKLDDEDEEVDDENIGAFLKAMNTLGHSSLLCSEDVTQSTLGIVQGLLLDCGSAIKLSEEQLERFKAAGVVLLGQQALRDRDIAEQVVPILGRLMRGSTETATAEADTDRSESVAQSAIRINAMKALADLCMRFTALVEPFLPDMCVTMKDPNPMVRETVIVIFVQLLLEDFVKMKGAFFYHVLTMLSDSDETIRELTIFLIKERLLAKNKLLMSQAFVKAIFHYNNCQLKHKFNERRIRKKEREVLTLPGRRNESKRRVIYDFMMEQLDPPSKLKILTRLNSEIFEGACEKFIDVGQSEGACVLRDVMYVISNDRMQASFGAKFQEDEAQEDLATAIETQTNNALNVIADGMKKFKLKVMTPSLVRLRQLLREQKSPLLPDVSKFFGKILQEFNKDQIAEILDEYPDLKKDIDRDVNLRKRATGDESGDSDVNETEGESSREKAVVGDVEERNLNAEGTSREGAPAAEPRKMPKSTPRKICEVSLTNGPRIVLRRLSALTYPGVESWKSPPREPAKVNRSPDPEPCSSGISVSSKGTSDDTTESFVDDLSDSELSSPKPNKLARLAESIADVKIS